MSVGDVTSKYFSIVVSFQKGATIQRLTLPCVIYSSEVKLKNYLNKCGIVLESCVDVKELNAELYRFGL
jgi:hypothetical protein